MSLSAPTKLTVPFANSGTKNTIPVASQIGITAGLASYTDGFPPLTMTPVASGGVPPFGQDFNGIFYAVTLALQWLQSGAGYAYDSAFSTAVGGYPLSARVQRSDGQGLWINTSANNTVDPESATTSGWLPLSNNATTAITMTSSNVTLTALQAGAGIIYLSGTLTANLNLVFPIWSKEWLVVNACTGSYTVTCKTAAGTGVAINAGANAIIYGDGTNINSLTNTQTAVSGLRSNLSISYTGTTGVVTVTANALTLNNSAGQSITLNTWSQTATSGNSSGAANSLDTGSWAFSTLYNLFAIYNPTTSTRGLLWSLSATAPTLPSGYTYFARIGANFTQSATSYYFLAGTQYNDEFFVKVGASGNRTSLQLLSGGTSAQGNPATPTYVAVSLTSAVPPTASKVMAIITSSGTANGQSMAAPNSSYGSVTSTSNPPPLIYCTPNTTLNLAVSQDISLESTSIYWAQSGNFYLWMRGWKDNL